MKIRIPAWLWIAVNTWNTVSPVIVNVYLGNSAEKQDIGVRSVLGRAGSLPVALLRLTQPPICAEE